MNYRSLLIVIFHLLCSAHLGFAQSSFNGESNEIPLWDVFEVSFINTVPYQDPFRDVSLESNFIRPDGRIISFWGYYDGEHTWKARFMPDTVGKWEYFAVFSDKTMAGKGEFEVVPSEIPGILVQDVSNSRWFGFQNGEHLLVRSLHTGDRFFASNWPVQERNKFLDWSQNQGYNTLSVASFFLNRNVEGRGQGWNTPALWHKSLNIPQPLEYEKAETIIKDLAQREMIIYPFAGFFGQSSDFPHDRQDQELYLKYTIARLAPFWNIIFNVAGPEPLWRPDAFDYKMPASEIIRLGSRIKELDPFDHILSVHNETGTDPFRHETWHDYVTVQGGKGNPGNAVYQYIIKQAEVSKPVFAQEVFWPGNKYHECDCNNVETIRRKAYILLFAGATINFADMDGNSSSGFSGSLDLDYKHQEWHDVMKSAWDWFESIPYYQMNPENELIENGYLIAESGVRYAIYIPDARDTVKLDLSAAPGKYTLRWFNTRTNKYEDKNQIVSGGNPVTIGDPPGEAEKDWIVLIENTSH